MPARTGCCCTHDRVFTLRKVNSSGSVAWGVNHYADWGAYTSATPTANPPVVNYTGSNARDGSAASTHKAQCDESGNFYQIGGPSVPVVSDKLLSQPTIDSLIAYNSSGTKLWGWSHQPTGDVSGATRVGPFTLDNLIVAADGTCIVTYYDGSGKLIMTGIDNAGSQIWSNTFSGAGTPGETITNPTIIGAGTDYFIGSVGNDTANIIPTGSDTGNTGFQLAVWEVATGNWVLTIAPFAAGGGANQDREHIAGFIGRDDHIYVAWDAPATFERVYGAGRVRDCGVAGSGLSNAADWDIDLLYIRNVTGLYADPVNDMLIVTGLRQAGSTSFSGGNPSYLDTSIYTEVYEKTTGDILRPLLVRDLSSSPVVTRHTGVPVCLGNGKLVYENTSAYQIWNIDPTSDVAESPFAAWAYEQHCGNFASTGESAWYSDPYCTNALNPYPDCGSTYTFTAQSDGGSGFEWVMPSSFRCSGTCYVVPPTISPTSLADTYVATCIQGTVCTGYRRYKNQYDGGTSPPAGYTPPPYFGSWAISGAQAPQNFSDCTSPCYSFRPPSQRPHLNVGGINPGDVQIDVECH